MTEQRPPAVDKTRINQFAEHAPHLKQELIDCFIEQTSLSIDLMLDSTDSSMQQAWKENAHKIKGSAGNMGAYPLSNIASDAEKNHQSSEHNKQRLLQLLVKEFELVKACLI